MNFNRRNFLSLLGVMPFGNVLATTISDKSFKTGGKVVNGVLQYTITAKPTKRKIVDTKESDTLEYHVDGQSKNMPFPILRAKQGQKIRVIFKNQMNKTTTIHWHGIRLPNNMDGVPYLTQMPIKPNGRFVYEFVCPDSGTFWFHSHQNSLEQTARGLIGALIVDEANTNHASVKQFSADAVWVIKDYYIKDNGNLDVCITADKMGEDGTTGHQRRTNGKIQAIASAPAGSWARIRLINSDNTRLMKIGAFDENNKPVDAYVMAIEGNPIKKYKKLNGDDLTPGQRLEIAVKVPPAGFVAIKDIVEVDFAGFDGEVGEIEMPDFNYTLGIVKSNGQKAKSKPLVSLPLNPIAKPDLKNKKKLKFVFLASPRSNGRMWSINGKSMMEHSSPADHELMGNPFSCGMEDINNKNGDFGDIFYTDKNGNDIAPEDYDMYFTQNLEEMAKPLAVLEGGKTYVFRLENGTTHDHPIHLHGYTFTVLWSSQKRITPYHTDTVPLKASEKMDIAFVADNPGNWMFHCHVIEHSATGMMGYIRVK